eukprot:m51a1_g5615 hypothetical protein (388) ;mRNA; f:745570-751138
MEVGDAERQLQKEEQDRRAAERARRKSELQKAQHDIEEELASLREEPVDSDYETSRTDSDDDDDEAAAKGAPTGPEGTITNSEPNKRRRLVIADDDDSESKDSSSSSSGDEDDHRDASHGDEDSSSHNSCCQGWCKGMTRDQDLGHDPVIYQAEAYAQAMMRDCVFDRKALFEYMQVVGKKLATAAKMNVAIKAFSMQALFSEEIVDATKATGAIDRKLVTADIKDHFRTACLNVFVMLWTKRDSIFDNIDDFRFVTHQKLVEVDISKANGKTIVPVIHKHIKKWEDSTFEELSTHILQQYLAKKRGRSHFDVGDYVLLNKDHDHKLDINVRGPFQVIKKLDHHCYTVENLLRDFRDDDPRSWISYDNNKNVNQVVTYMQAHPHLRT